MPFPRLRWPVPRADLALALGLAVAGVLWAASMRHDGPATGPFPLRLPDKLLPPEPTVPDPRIRLADDTYRDFETRAMLINIVVTLPVAFRRRLPYTAVVAALAGVFALREGLTWPGFLGIMVVAYSAVAYGRYLAGSLAILLGGAAVAARVFSDSIPEMPGWLTPFAVLVPVGLAAATIRGLRARADAAARRADALERERDAATRAAIAEERARIARELHDVVSHHVSVMIIQAGAAGKVLDTRPDLAGNALAAIEASGRDAMTELRHMLGLVAPLDDALRPQPGPSELAALVASVRAAGQPVTFRAGGVPPSLDLTVYRVVQEGLTNALRHAPGASTDVSVRTDDGPRGGTVLIEIVNGPPARPPGPPMGTGAGLVGLAERLRLYEGTLDARPVSGGFRLSARIPVPAGDRGDVPAGAA